MGYWCKYCGKIVGSTIEIGTGQKMIERPDSNPSEICFASSDGRHLWQPDCSVISFDYLYSLFKNGEGVDETVFVFMTDNSKTEHYLGYLPNEENHINDKPYWAGYCDIEDGFCCSTAEELFNAKIYNELSIKERWPEVYVKQIGGINVDDWLEMYETNKRVRI